MLMRRATAYSIPFSQIVSLYLYPFCCSLLLKCALQPEVPKTISKNFYFGAQGHLRSSMLIV